MVKYFSAEQIQELIESKETCILNLVASWCPDCTEQSNNFNVFASRFIAQGISVYELNVQDEKNIFLSPLHQQLTQQFGGHGFPRTILIREGESIDADNVEVISKAQLSELADKFKEQLHLN